MGLSISLNIFVISSVSSSSLPPLSPPLSFLSFPFPSLSLSHSLSISPYFSFFHIFSISSISCLLFLLFKRVSLD